MNQKYNPSHFYLIFDPYFQNEQYKKISDEYSQAHAFADLLKEKLKEDPNASLYWGKLSMSKKKKELPEQFLKDIVLTNDNKGCPTYLYISDFINFWVAKVEAVEFGDDQKFYSNSLPFYSSCGHKTEVWFKISDIDLLSKISNETHQYIKQLHCVKDGSEITPFLSNLRYPLQVHDSDLLGMTHFDGVSPKVNDISFENKTFEQKIKNIITRYSIPKEDFQLLDHSVQNLIINTEMDFYDDRFHNWPNLYFNYYKALELQLNHVVLGYLKEEFSDSDIMIRAKSEKSKGRFYCHSSKKIERGENLIPVKEFHGNFSICEIINDLFKGNNKLSMQMANHQIFSKSDNISQFVSKKLSTFLNRYDFINVRNIITHKDIDKEKIHEDEFFNIRKEILGLGQESLLIKLCKSSPLYNPHTFSIKKAA